jgi:hypothetical protein
VCAAAENNLLFSKANIDVAKRKENAPKNARFRTLKSVNAHRRQTLEFVAKVPTLGDDIID